MSGIEERVGRGTCDTGVKAITFLREHVVPGQTDVEWEKMTVPLQRAAMILPVSEEMLEDAPVMRSYVYDRAPELLLHSLGDLVVKAIEDAGVKHYRTRPWETNHRAIRRAEREVLRAGGFDVEDEQPISRSKTVVGAFEQGASLWTEGEVQIEMSNPKEHLIAVRLEQPVAVTVFRADAFGIVHTREWRRVRRVKYAVLRAWHRVFGFG